MRLYTRHMFANESVERKGEEKNSRKKLKARDREARWNREKNNK